MKNLVSSVVMLLFFSCINCKKKGIEDQEALILQRIDFFIINEVDARTGEFYYRNIYDNDSVFYHDSGIRHIYMKGRKINIKVTDDIRTKDSLVNSYKLKKVKFELKRNYQDHFEYEDCTTNRKIKMDSGVVHTLHQKNGATYQVIDIYNKPILLKICHRNKTYKAAMLSGINYQANELLGNGYSTVMFYDIDKDGEDELLLIREKYDTKFADVYKINLPK